MKIRAFYKGRPFLDGGLFGGGLFGGGLFVGGLFAGGLFPGRPFWSYPNIQTTFLHILFML